LAQFSAGYTALLASERENFRQFLLTH